MSNKVALITGANRGIGFETARQLGQLGYTVLVGARDASKGETAAAQIREEGIDAHALTLDLSDASTFPPVVSEIEAKFGKLDALVNNAGVMLDQGYRPSEVPVEILKQTFEVNVFNLYALTQSLLPLLRKSEAGRVVNLSSILGSLSLNADPKAPIGDFRLLAYNSSKTAVNALTTVLAVDLAKDSNIKVNAAHPGWVKTEMGGEAAPMEIVDGAKTSVRLATLPKDGPTGGYFHMADTLPW